MNRITPDNPFYNFKSSEKRQKDAKKWLQDVIEDKVDPSKSLKEAQEAPKTVKEMGKQSGLYPGQMFFAGYDAKWKDILDVWDKAPLFIVLDLKNDRANVLNIHYMPVGLRLNMLAMLNQFAIGKGTEEQRFMLSWEMVKYLSRLNPLKECIKTHLYSHYTSPPLKIHPDNYETIASLPIERWVIRKSNKK